MKTYTIPPPAGLGALACGSQTTGDDCPCKHRGGMGFVELPAPDDTTSTDTAAGGIAFDWHWLAIAALAILAAWALWPKPERERRNTERRSAKAAYLRKLDSIDGGKKK